MNDSEQTKVILPFYSTRSDITLLLQTFIDMYRNDSKHLFREDIVPVGVYGNFRHSKLAAGNYVHGNHRDNRVSLKDIRGFKTWLQDSELDLYLDLSNFVYTKKLIFSYYDNCILDMLQGAHSYACITSPEIYEYVKSTYRFNIVKSILCKNIGKSCNFSDVAAVEISLDDYKEDECNSDYIICINDPCLKCFSNKVCVERQCNANVSFKPISEFNTQYKYDGTTIQQCDKFSEHFLNTISMTQCELPGCTIKVAAYPFYMVNDYCDMLVKLFVEPEKQMLAKSILLHTFEQRRLYLEV